jgi:type I restriction enzyme, R subunit
MPDQFSEHIARDKIDALLIQSGWIIRERTKINLNAGSGIAVKEYLTDVGPADYVLFVNKEAIVILQAGLESFRAIISSLNKSR